MLFKQGGDGLIMHNFTSTIGEICYNTKSDCRFARECQQPHQLGAGISAQQSFRPQCPQWIASHIAMAKAQQGVPFTRLTNTGSCILATLLTQPSYIQIHRVGSHWKESNNALTDFFATTATQTFSCGRRELDWGVDFQNSWEQCSWPSCYRLALYLFISNSLNCLDSEVCGLSKLLRTMLDRRLAASL